MSERIRRANPREVWEYGFGSPALDTRPSPYLQPPGTFSRLTGVDGRYFQRLRRFPGFYEEATLPSQAEEFWDPADGDYGVDKDYTFGDSAGNKHYHYFCIQEETNRSGLLRGIIFLGQDHNSKTSLYAYYYRTSTSTTQLQKIGYVDGAAGSTTAISYIGMSHNHRHIFVVGQLTDGTSIDRAFRFNYDAVPANESWVGWLISPSEPGLAPDNTFLKDSPVSGDYGHYNTQVAGTTAGGWLQNGQRYGFAYRLVCPEQDMYGPLSDILELTAATNSYVSGFRTNALGTPANHGLVFAATAWATKRYIEYWRTVGSGFGDISRIGSLYLERRQEINITAYAGGDRFIAFWGVRQGGFDAAGPFFFQTAMVFPPSANANAGLSDTAMASRLALDPQETRSFVTLPPGKRIAHYEGLLVLATDTVGSGDEGPDTETLRWSTVNRDRQNLFPLEHYKAPEDLSDSFKELVRAGSFLAAVMDNHIFRIHRSGSRVSIDTLHNRHGASSRHGILAIGTNLLMVSPVGLLLVDLGSGQVDVLSASQHKLDKTTEWRASLEDVQAAYDSRIGAAIFHNPTEDEMLLVWMNEGVLTHLEDCPWDWILTGSDFTNGGVTKALFINEASKRIFSVDVDGSADTATMNGGATGPDYNGVVSTYAGAVITPSGTPALPTDNSLDGFYVHFTVKEDGTEVTGVTGERRTISSTNATTFTMNSALSGNPTGVQYHLAPIPFKVSLSPVGMSSEGAMDAFSVKKVRGMGALWRELSGDTTGAFCNYQLFEDDSDTAERTAYADITTVPAHTYWSAPHRGTVIVPGMECCWSNLTFELLGCIVQGSEEASRKDR